MIQLKLADRERRDNLSRYIWVNPDRITLMYAYLPREDLRAAKGITMGTTVWLEGMPTAEVVKESPELIAQLISDLDLERAGRRRGYLDTRSGQ